MKASHQLPVMEYKRSSVRGPNKHAQIMSGHSLVYPLPVSMIRCCVDHFEAWFAQSKTPSGRTMLSSCYDTARDAIKETKTLNMVATYNKI